MGRSNRRTYQSAGSVSRPHSSSTRPPRSMVPRTATRRHCKRCWGPFCRQARRNKQKMTLAAVQEPGFVPSLRATTGPPTRECSHQRIVTSLHSKGAEV